MQGARAARHRGFVVAIIVIAAGMLVLAGCSGPSATPQTKPAEAPKPADPPKVVEAPKATIPPKPTDPPKPQASSQPSRDELIEAVRSSVNGKTYPETVLKPQEQTRPCTPTDARYHTYGCVTGGTYRVTVQVPTTEYRPCPTLPGPDPSWNVQSLGNNKWRVSRTTSRWDVEQTAGSPAKAGGAVTAGSFSFSIVPAPNQPC